MPARLMRRWEWHVYNFFFNDGRKTFCKEAIPLEQSMPWNPGKQWHTPELHSPLPWQLRGHSCTESVKKTK